MSAIVDSSSQRTGWQRITFLSQTATDCILNAFHKIYLVHYILQNIVYSKQNLNKIYYIPLVYLSFIYFFLETNK